MKIALCGYGKMGREVEQVVQESKKHEIVTIQCWGTQKRLDMGAIRRAHVVIDFTSGKAMRAHLAAYCEAGVNAVIGTTGWDMHDPAVRASIEQAGIGVVVGTNFSAGVQIFLQLVAEASRRFYRLGGYDVYGVELHHAAKSDSPSGTARTISQVILDNFPSKTEARFDRTESVIGKEELHIASVRGGHQPGKHEVIFDSATDEVVLTHTARGRRSFAKGALLAAEYIRGKSGLVFFEQLFQPGGPYAA
jgi:4-hydroxy-tetrahydrodipicolinate reductase